MNLAAFDTLAFTEELEAAGIPEEQARAQVRALAKAIEAKDLATKADLKELEKELKTDLRELELKFEAEFKGVRGEIKELELGIKSEIKELELKFDAKFNLIKWMLLLIIAATVLPALKAFFAGG